MPDTTLRKAAKETASKRPTSSSLKELKIPHFLTRQGVLMASQNYRIER
jgi:hypothetical protein